MTIVLFILILVVLILVHEFGHFIIAKAFGIRVDEFGIFFPPRIWAIKKGETEYSINWIPVGGFVRIFGENYNEGKSDPRSFINKPRVAQALVIIAGIAFNVLFAWLALSVGYMAGLPTSVEHQGYGTVTNPQAMIVEVLPSSPAQKAGLMGGDTLVSIQTADTTMPRGANAEQATNFITSHSSGSVVLTVMRDGQSKTFLAKAEDGIIAGRKAIGVELDDVGVLQLPPHLALAEGAILGWNIIQSTAGGLLQFFSQIFHGAPDLSQVAGPIGITLFGAAAIKQGFGAAVVLTALISINLALINLVPIPGLDGSRLLVIIIESVIRRPVPAKLINTLTLAGMALLLALMVLVSLHDISKLIG